MQYFPCSASAAHQHIRKNMSLVKVTGAVIASLELQGHCPRGSEIAGQTKGQTALAAPALAPIPLVANLQLQATEACVCAGSGTITQSFATGFNSRLFPGHISFLQMCQKFNSNHCLVLGKRSAAAPLCIKMHGDLKFISINVLLQNPATVCCSGDCGDPGDSLTADVISLVMCTMKFTELLVKYHRLERKRKNHRPDPCPWAQFSVSPLPTKYIIRRNKFQLSCHFDSFVDNINKTQN